MGYIIDGVVVEGRKLGRELGFPTANVELGDDAAVDNGVYESRVTIVDSGESYGAVTNIGVNPTIGAVTRRSESYLLDFEGDLYGQVIRVELLCRLRGEQCFESVAALREQVLNDIKRVRDK